MSDPAAADTATGVDSVTVETAVETVTTTMTTTTVVATTSTTVVNSSHAAAAADAVSDATCSVEEQREEKSDVPESSSCEVFVPAAAEPVASPVPCASAAEATTADEEEELAGSKDEEKAAATRPATMEKPDDNPSTDALPATSPTLEELAADLPARQQAPPADSAEEVAPAEKSSAQRHRQQHADPYSTVDDVLKEKRALLREIDALRSRNLHNVEKADESRRKEHVHTTLKQRAESAYEQRKAEQEEHRLNLKLRAEQRVEEARQAAEIIRRKKEEANAKRAVERQLRAEQVKKEEAERKLEFQRIFQIRRDAAAQRAANARELVKAGSLVDMSAARAAAAAEQPAAGSPKRVSSSALMAVTERSLHFREVAWVNPSIITSKSNAELYKDGDLLERQLRIESIREMRETKQMLLDQEKQRHKEAQQAILEAKRQLALSNQEKVHIARQKEAPVPIEASPKRMKRNVIKEENEALRTARQQKDEADRQRRKELHDALVASRQEKSRQKGSTNNTNAQLHSSNGTSPDTVRRMWQEELVRRAREEQEKHKFVQEFRAQQLAEKETRRPGSSGPAELAAHQQPASFQDLEELKALRRERRKLLHSLGLPYEGDDDSNAGSVSPSASQQRASRTLQRDSEGGLEK